MRYFRKMVFALGGRRGGLAAAVIPDGAVRLADGSYMQLANGAYVVSEIT